MALTGHGRPINQVGAFYVPIVSPDPDDHVTTLRAPVFSDIARVPTTSPWIALGSAAVLLAGVVVSVPFSNANANPVTPVSSSPSQQVPYNSCLLTPPAAPAAPFAQYSWPPASPLPSSRPQATPYNINV